MRKILPIIILSAALFGCPSDTPTQDLPLPRLAASPQSTPSPAKGNTPALEGRIKSDREKKLIDSIDDHLGSFVSNGHSVDFESMPDGYGMGYSKQYAPFDRRAWGTVFFYHAGQANLKDGIGSREFKDMYAANTSPEYFAAGYKDVKNRKNADATYNGIPFRRHQFTGTIKSSDRKTSSVLFLTIYRGTFLKVRFDWDIDYREGARDVENFMNALTANLKKNGAKK